MASLVVLLGLTILFYLLYGLVCYLFKIRFPWIGNWVEKTITRTYKALPECLRLCWDFIDEFVNGPIYSRCTKEGKITRPWFAQHLTEEQWRQHRRSFKHYSRRIGKYTNFHGGTIGWLKCEGLSPITAEMKAELEERDRQYEKRLLDEEMFAELAEWQENKRRRQAVIEAIGV